MKPIPSLFHDFEGNPFTHCRLCEKNLNESSDLYIIERAIKRYPELETEQTVFEHAICLKCAEGQQGKLSEDSKLALKHYFEGKGREDYEYIDEPDQCFITRKPLHDQTEFQVFALCIGDHLMPRMGFPFALSGEVMEEIQDQLSAETKEFLDDYTETHFGLPPDWADSPLKPSLLF